MPSRFAKDAATPRRHASIHQTHSPGKDHDLRRHNKRPGFVPSENENGNHTTVAINVPGLGDVSHGQVSRWNRQSKTDEFREGQSPLLPSRGAIPNAGRGTAAAAFRRPHIALA